VLFLGEFSTPSATTPASRPCWESDPPYPDIPEIHPCRAQSDAVGEEVTAENLEKSASDTEVGLGRIFPYPISQSNLPVSNLCSMLPRYRKNRLSAGHPPAPPPE